MFVLCIMRFRYNFMHLHKLLTSGTQQLAHMAKYEMWMTIDVVENSSHS